VKGRLKIDLKGKTELLVEFPGHPEITPNKEFECPNDCGQKHNISKDNLMHSAGNIPLVASVLSKMAKLIDQYYKKPESFSDYFDLRAPYAKLEHQLAAIGDSTISIGTSIKLACGYSIHVNIRADIEPFTEPKKLDVLRTLGLNSEKAWRWLSYIYSPEGKVNLREGKKRAERIQYYIDTMQRERETYEALKKHLDENVPSSETGVDIKKGVAESIRKINEKWNEVMMSIIEEIEEPLAHSAMIHTITEKPRPATVYGPY
jgi:hypothetical protein